MSEFAVATIVGVPLANLLGQWLGWRGAFTAEALLALLTVLLLWALVPQDRPAAGASPLRKLGALRSGQVWLTLSIGAVGFGGMFAVYTYLASTLTLVTHVPAHVLP